jgi:hypothetical protein
MNMHWIGVVVAAASATVGSFPPYCRDTIIEGAVVISHSSRPTTLSTFSITWVKIQVRTSRTETDEFNMPYMESNQFIPPADSVCKIAFHTAPASGGAPAGPIPGDRELKVVDELSCDSGTFIMKW